MEKVAAVVHPLIHLLKGQIKLLYLNKVILPKLAVAPSNKIARAENASR